MTIFGGEGEGEGEGGVEVTARCLLIVLFSMNRPNYSGGVIIYSSFSEKMKTKPEETEQKVK